MEKKFYRSKVLVKNAKTGEDVPKWELEEEQHSNGSRYYIHYYSPKGHYEIIQVNSHFQYGNRHLQYLSENHPERIQKLLDKGNIYYYIAKLDRRITRAVDGQVRKWKESDTDYLTAVRNGDFLATNGLIINMTFRAEEAVLPTMLYA